MEDSRPGCLLPLDTRGDASSTWRTGALGCPVWLDTRRTHRRTVGGDCAPQLPESGALHASTRGWWAQPTLRLCSIIHGLGPRRMSGRETRQNTAPGAPQNLTHGTYTNQGHPLTCLQILSRSERPAHSGTFGERPNELRVQRPEDQRSTEAPRTPNDHSKSQVVVRVRGNVAGPIRRPRAVREAAPRAAPTHTRRPRCRARRVIPRALTIVVTLIPI